jgi:chlorophyll synthase
VSAPPERARRAALFLNHADAWGLTTVISTTALAVHNAFNGDGGLAVLALSATCWAAFAYNDYHDAHFDCQEPTKRRRNYFAARRHADQPVPQAYFRRAAVVIAALLLLLYLPFGLRGVSVLALCLVGLVAYSAPPLRLKSRPGLDLAMHAVFIQTAPYFATLFLCDLPLLRADLLLLAIFFFSSLAAQLEQQARDFALDARTERNFATSIGLPRTIALLKIATAALVALAVIGALSGSLPAPILPLGLAAAPVLVHRFTRPASAPRAQPLVMLSVTLALAYCAALWLGALLA